MAVEVMLEPQKPRRYLNKRYLQGIDTTCQFCGGRCVVRNTKKDPNLEPDDDRRLQRRYCEDCGKPGVVTWGSVYK